MGLLCRSASFNSLRSCCRGDYSLFRKPAPEIQAREEHHNFIGYERKRGGSWRKREKEEGYRKKAKTEGERTIWRRGE
ncbi:hypothetical protein L484_003981 [Morus notabilis]|uniref:Uncharacterized protein n=1 Tax=Morus notabilis TaxID=981085 RepID=W9QZT7_9ROSA|nr:hypothetical protein L484_003981 [Morus notabilis]